MQLSRDSAFLSNEVYYAKPDITGFDSLENFVEEPDQALVAEKDGYCFLAFRGTTLTMNDWFQNFQVGEKKVTSLKGETTCKAREGFQEAYYKPKYTSQVEKAVNNCVQKCDNIDECLVITGHSQGGAIAAVAGIVFSGYDPYVITFGEPPSVDPDCEAISSAKWYRYVNTVSSQIVSGIAYDPVPFCPGLGTIVYGNMIILSDDNKDVAFVGLDSTQHFSPLNMAGATAHSMVGDKKSPGYLDRIETLMDNAKSYPIPTDGFRAVQFCTDDIECESKNCGRKGLIGFDRCIGTECKGDRDCKSGRCDSGTCLPKLGSCMGCNEDSDCASGDCYLGRCANSNGKMDINCRCLKGSDCANGRCEGVVKPTCEARLSAGSRCNENSDCLSGKCSWRFRCKAGRRWNSGQRKLHTRRLNTLLLRSVLRIR